MVHLNLTNNSNNQNKNQSLYYQFIDDMPSYGAQKITKKPLPDKSLKQPYKILLVEDDPVSQKAQKILLEIQGYQVDAVFTGEEALTIFSKGYDIIILDIGLPGISGIDTAKAIRQLKNGTEIPIIGLTAHGVKIVEECINAGFNEVAHKPIMDYISLNKIIMKYLS